MGGKMLLSEVIGEQMLIGSANVGVHCFRTLLIDPPTCVTQIFGFLLWDTIVSA